jgi:SAM-dependent methyltransferase
MPKDLRKLERVWYNLGRQDPFWAALTDTDKRHGGWSRDEFFRTGSAEIDATLETAARNGWTIKRGRALDFGCGAGRLTQALAARFDRVDGVDISRSMITRARRNNRYGDKCRYLHNAAPDLSVFPDAAFDFIYSALTLQHIPSEYAQRYIAEFVRLLAPRGMMIFQLPSHRAPIEPGGAGGRTVAAAGLPPDAFAAEVSLDTPAGTWMASETRLLSVSVRNSSARPWAAGSRDDGCFRIQLGNRWLTADGHVLVANDGRTPLPHDISPDEMTTLFLEVTAPSVNGEYVLDIDMVQEHVAWFQEIGSTPSRTRCRVTGGQPATTHVPAPRPFAERFPRLHSALVNLGIDVVRGGFKRYRERRRTGRWQRAAMVMHCLPRAQVVELIERLGASVLAVEQELISGGYQSCRYWITRTETTHDREHGL